jgi:hypothetical protein
VVGRSAAADFGPMTNHTTPHTTSAASPDTTTLEQRLLTASLLIAPVLFLAADTTYAARGWDDPTAGVLHVLASIGYGFVALRIAGWLPRGSPLRVGVAGVGLVGMAGSVAYGFDTIHMSLGDTPLVDQSGAATLIKPLGLCLPLALAMMAVAMLRLGARWQGALVLVAALVWPVAHIANVAPLAVAVNVALVLGLASLLWQPLNTLCAAATRP